MNKIYEFASELSEKFRDVTINLEFESGYPSCINTAYRYHYGKQFLEFVEYLKTITKKIEEYHHFIAYRVEDFTIYVDKEEIKKAEINN